MVVVVLSQVKQRIPFLDFCHSAIVRNSESDFIRASGIELSSRLCLSCRAAWCESHGIAQQRCNQEYDTACLSDERQRLISIEIGLCLCVRAHVGRGPCRGVFTAEQGFGWVPKPLPPGSTSTSLLMIWHKTLWDVNRLGNNGPVARPQVHNSLSQKRELGIQCWIQRCQMTFVDVFLVLISWKNAFRWRSCLFALNYRPFYFLSPCLQHQKANKIQS